MTKTADDKNRYLMYMHAGSGNHGCEAIVRSLCGTVEGEVTVLSHKPEEDDRYGLSECAAVIPTRHSEKSIFTRTWFYARRKLTGNADALMKYTYAGAKPLNRYDLAVSIGGDNYCYSDALFGLMSANHMFAGCQVPTALVGCSIEPKLLEDGAVREDMKRYRTIIARESITYDALCRALQAKEADPGHGISGDTHIFLTPDPAFALKPAECELPEGFVPGHTIGINVSPMILGYENSGNPGITLKNYRNLIKTILEETDEKIALIPHVVTDNSDDRIPLRVLKEFADSLGSGVILVEDHPAEELKYIISRCSMLIAARTHASIAAYSTCVPTLVVGYSVKSRGIATDLFGTTEGCVIPVQELKGENDLTDAWRNLRDRSGQMKDTLRDVIPDVIKRTESIGRILGETIERTR